MKRSDIRNAYDAMTPTPQQRDKMYRAIMKAGGKQNGRYQAQPTKQHKWAWIPAAAAVIFICIMGVLVLGRGAQDDVVLTNPVETEAVPPAHEALLDVYRTAIKEGWTEEQCQQNGISPQLADVQNTDEKPAYVLLDIDGNGIEELIVGHGMPHYFYVWDLYSFENFNGEPVKLHTDVKDHANCHLYENGIIGIEFAGKSEGYFHYFGLQGTKLVRADLLSYRDDIWRDVVTNEQIPSDQANQILAKYEIIDVEPIDLMKNQNANLGDIEAVEQYAFIVEKYKTALLENWTWEQCDEAEISRQIMFNTTNMNDLGWCLLDLDGNGVQELVVSDGEYLFDCYTLTTQVKHVFSASPVDHYSLCKDGTIKHRSNFGVDTFWTWYDISATKLAMQGILHYDGDTDKYFYGTTKDHLGSISEEEAETYLVNPEKTTMDLTLTPFVEREFTVVKEPNFYYESIIETYRTAITEHWDPGKCMEKGISLMVGYYGGIVPDLGHNQIDLNGDGNDELIITDGTNIYDMYTIVNDEEVGTLRLIDATERNQFYLTIDGQIYNIASGSAMLSYYYLFDIGQKELVFDKGLKFDASVDPNNPWSFYEESMDTAVSCTTEDARVILDAIHFADMSYIPFVSGMSSSASANSQHYFKDYAEHIEWLIPWREEEFEDPRPLYYCLTDCNKDGIIDLLYGYEDSVLSVWSYMYDKNSKTEHLTLLMLSEAEYKELDKVWLNMDIRNIKDFQLN